MLAKDEEGIDRELRVSYFGQDQGWGLTKGIDFAPRDAGDHIGIGLGRKATQSLSFLPHDVVPSVGPGQSSARRPEARRPAESAASGATDRGSTHAKAAEIRLCRAGHCARREDAVAGSD